MVNRDWKVDITTCHSPLTHSSHLTGFLIARMRYKILNIYILTLNG
jgi:hypothetical protein